MVSDPEGGLGTPERIKDDGHTSTHGVALGARDQGAPSSKAYTLPHRASREVLAPVLCGPLGPSEVLF